MSRGNTLGFENSGEDKAKDRLDLLYRDWLWFIFSATTILGGRVS
jgi:hypothetical protein